MANIKISELIASLITNTVVPELIDYLKSRGSTNIPTEEELEARLHTVTQRYLAMGRAFLQAHGIDPDA